MASYTYRSSGAAVSSTSGANLDLSSSAPAGKTNGDLLLLFSTQRGTVASISLTSGWTQLYLDVSSGGFGVWARIADGTAADSPSTVDWDGTGFCVAWLEAYYGDVFTDLASIVAHSNALIGTAANLQLPTVTSVTTDNCLVVAFGVKNNTATDATTISHAALTKRTQYVSTSASRQHAATASVQQTTATDYDGTDFTINGTVESLASKGVVLFLQSAAAAKYLKLLAHSSAASATDVEGVVLNAARDTVIGEFSGQAFEADLESGEAVLLIAATDITPNGSTLTTSDTPIVFAYNATDSLIGPASATVIEV